VIRILGIDPGGTTGVIVLHFTSRRPFVTGPFQFAHGADVMEVLSSELVGPKLTLVAMERFVVSRRAGRSKTAGAGEQARNIIGAVTALCQKARVTVVTRSASQVKHWATDKRLEAAGLLAPTRGLPHARDAARHALYAAVWDCGLPDPLSTKDSA